MSKFAPDHDNVGRRSSRRSSVSEADVKVSRGGPVNAARLDRDVLREMASQNNTLALSVTLLLAVSIVLIVSLSV